MSLSLSLQIPNFLMSQVRKLNENSNRRYQFYDRRIKNLLRKIHTDSREKPDKNTSDVSCFTFPRCITHSAYSRPRLQQCLIQYTVNYSHKLLKQISKEAPHIRIIPGKMCHCISYMLSFKCKKQFVAEMSLFCCFTIQS